MVAVLVAVQWVVVDPAGWYPFGPIRWLSGTVLVLVAAGLVLASGRVAIDRSTGLAWVALLVLLGVGAVFGVDGRYAWTGTPERMLGWATWALFAVAFLVGLTIGSPPPGEQSDAASDRTPAGSIVARWWSEETVVRAGLVAAALGVGAVAAAEAFGFEPGPFGAGGDRLTGSFGNSSFLGAAAALLLPVAVGVAADRGRSRGLRAVAIAAGAGLVVAVVGSGARAAWVGLAGATVLTAWMARRRITRRRAAGFGLLGVVGVGLVLAFTPAGPRLASLADDDAPGGAGRLDEWRVAARVVADHPVVGVGPEGYRIAFADGVDLAYERAHGRDPLPDRAHSAPLDVALAGGLGAAIAYLVLAGLVGRACLRVLRAGPMWRRGVAVGLLAHGIGLLFFFPTFELGLVVGVLAGLVVAWGRSTIPEATPDVVSSDHDDGSARDGGSATPSMRVGTSVVWVSVSSGLAPVFAALAFGALVTGVGDVRADRRAHVAADALGRGEAVEAVAAVEDAIRLRPDVVRYRLLAARARVAAEEGQRAALAELDRALLVSPRDPVVRLERARTLIRRAAATGVPDHLVAARSAVDELVADDPVLAEARLLDGDLAVVEGRADAAVAAYRAAAVRAPRSVEPWLGLWAVHRTEGDGAAADEALGHARRIDPSDPAVRAAIEADTGR